MTVVNAPKSTILEDNDVQIGAVEIKDQDSTTRADVVTNTDDDTNIDGTNGLVGASMLYARTSASIAKPLRMDASTHTLQTIEYEHHEIHSGSHYFVKDYVTLNTNGTFDVAVTTPDTEKWAHILFKVITTGETEIEIYEGTNFTTAGTAVTPYNNNRNSSNTSGLSIAVGRSISGMGTKISDSLLGLAATPARVQGGTVQRDDELILKQNEDYLIRLTSASEDNNIDYRATWYEHTDKD